MTNDNNENQVKFKFKHLFQPASQTPTLFTSQLADWISLVCVTFIVALCFLLSNKVDELAKWYYILLVTLLCLFISFCMIVIWCQPQVTNITTFKVKKKELDCKILFSNILLIKSFFAA
jgi:hypothetical protein